jgi:hypothetical protein
MTSMPFVSGKPKIDDKQVRHAERGLTQALLSGFRLEHNDLLGFQRGAYEASDLPVVFDDDNGHLGFAHE